MSQNKRAPCADWVSGSSKRKFRGEFRGTGVPKGSAAWSSWIGFRGSSGSVWVGSRGVSARSSVPARHTSKGSLQFGEGKSKNMCHLFIQEGPSVHLRKTSQRPLRFNLKGIKHRTETKPQLVSHLQTASPGLISTHSLLAGKGHHYSHLVFGDEIPRGGKVNHAKIGGFLKHWATLLAIVQPASRFPKETRKGERCR